MGIQDMQIELMSETGRCRSDGNIKDVRSAQRLIGVLYYGNRRYDMAIYSAQVGIVVRLTAKKLLVYYWF
jgi:hypothetical protein